MATCAIISARQSITLSGETAYKFQWIKDKWTKLALSKQEVPPTLSKVWEVIIENGIDGVIEKLSPECKVVYKKPTDKQLAEFLKDLKKK